MATVRVTHDVKVTHLDDSEAAVITAHTLPVGERMLLEICDEQGVVSKARLVRTGTTRFAFKDGRLRREVQLSVIGRTGFSEGQQSIDSKPATMTPLVGAVIRRVPVRLVEVSASGCLWDASAPLDEGAVGFLEVRTGGHHRVEAVRIVRTLHAAGAPWPYQMAAEFLTLAPLSPDSLRGVAAVVATGAATKPQFSVGVGTRF